jgi:Zn finger protein HypA/HybF involved in hydrogenase expression|tara:strand:- start:5618 stop:5944 length:327 start_codon:yes stop_codon:yes gene_type:complete
MQEEYKAEGEKVFKCPKCDNLDCIYGDFAINGVEWHNGIHYESFKPLLKPTETDMWCQYMYKGKMVQGNTLLDEIQELRMECKHCGYDFDGQDDELNDNIVVIHGGVE